MLAWLERLWGKPRASLPMSGVFPLEAAGITPGGNPGKGPSLKVAFFHSEVRSWEEEVNLPELLVEALGQKGLTADFCKGEVTLTGSGLILTPQMVSFKPLEEGKGTKSCTTIATRHPLVFSPVFEYQHSAGHTMRESVLEGFSNWIQVDLPVLINATRVKPEDCTYIETPVREPGLPERWRRILMGPTQYTGAPPPSIAADAGEEEHAPGCSCCFFTRLHPVIKPLIEAKGFVALRAFSMRDENGEAAADCRVNGEDFEAGAKALREYASERPGGHFEWRKQLIVIQDCHPSAA